MPDTRPRVWLDHFVVGIDDLEAGIETFETLTGVRPLKAGEHPALGTHNALVSLGPNRYLELLAPRPGASVDPRFRYVSGCQQLTPVLWALATDEVDELQRRVTSAGFHADTPAPGSRVTSDGDTVRWTMFWMQSEAPPNSPFFTSWDAATRHPSTTTPTGCSLQSFELSSPSSEALVRLLDTVGFTARVAAGPRRLTVSLDTPNGTVVLGGNS